MTNLTIYKTSLNLFSDKKSNIYLSSFNFQLKKNPMLLHKFENKSKNLFLTIKITKMDEKTLFFFINTN